MAIDSSIQVTGITYGAVYVRIDDGTVWNGAAYEAVTPANFANYPVTGVATGLVDVDGNEMFHFPRPGLTAVAHYLQIWQKSGGTWVMGTAALLAIGESIQNGVTLAASERVYNAWIDLTRDPGNTRDEYSAAFGKDLVPLGAVTGTPQINVIKRSDGSNLIATTNMTQVGATGIWKFDTTTAGQRLTPGEAAFCFVTATIDGSPRVFHKIVARDG